MVLRSPARRVAALAAFATLIAALGLAWFAGRSRAAADPAALLARLVPGHRPLLARITVEGAWAPFDPAAPKADPAALERAYGELLAAKIASVAGARAALTAFHVVRGEAGDVERALVEAEDPLDRGAALLALDRADEALEELAKALEARPADPRALFDRALALEALLLDGQAQEAWEAFLAVEGEGRWAEEARARLASSKARPPAPRALEQRKREALGALYEAHPRGLDALRPLAEELAAVGDRLLIQELRFLEGLDPAGWRRREDDARRFALLSDAVFAGENRGSELRVLAGVADPLIGVKALHFGAYGAIVRGDAVDAGRWLSELAGRCKRVGCLEELALVTSDEGTLRHRAGDFAGALAQLETAGELLPAAFVNRRAELLEKRATVLLSTGATESAARNLDEVIRIQRADGMINRLSVPLLLRGHALGKLGRRSAAQATFREAAHIAAEEGSAKDHLMAVRDLARSLASGGGASEAEGLLASAIERLRKKALGPELVNALTDLAWVRLELGANGTAREVAREAVALARKLDLPEATASALGELARAERALGAPHEALAALEEGAALDARRARTAPDALAALRVRVGAASRRMLRALVLGEAGRAEEAFRVFAEGRPGPLEADECRLGLGVSEGRLFTVAATGTGFSFSQRTVERRQRGELRSAGQTALVGSLLGPDRCPATTRRLAVLGVPGALQPPLDRCVGLDRTRVIVAVLRAPGTPWPRVPRGGPALVVHSPERCATCEATQVLRGAAREAALLKVARIADELEGSAASPEEVRRTAPSHGILHFAVHGVSRAGSGAASYLQLSGDPGRLQVADILGLDLRAMRPLVFLSACSTAGFPGDLEHDGAGLPWAFLHAGASAVLAAEGELDDEAGVAFAGAFYRALATSDDVSDAVQEATRAVDAIFGGDRAARFVLYF